MKALKWIDNYFEEAILAVLLFVMMMIMGIQVTARYALGNSLSWSEEITRFCFIWTGFLSISFCIKKKASIAIEQFVDLFEGIGNGIGAKLIRTITTIIEMIFFAYLLPFAFHYVNSAYISQATSPACGIPMWCIQSITIISFILCEIRLLQNLFENVKAILGKGDHK